MTLGSISILRQNLRPLLYSILCQDRTNLTSSAVFLLHNYITLSASADVRKQQQPKKHQNKAREISKQHFSSSSASLSPALSPNNKPQLSENQAIGTVASSLANFKRVVVNSENSGSVGVELLCVVKGVLKNINTRVLVGDEVLVGAIDWVDRRGRIEKVFPRKSEILDPSVANVDHLLLMFSLEQPKIKPYMLTRFLVEAECTGIPLTLVLNKAELIDETTLLEWESRLRSWGYEVVLCSVNTERGLDKLKLILRDQTSVIFGPSGVGKSSLINALRGNKNVLGATEDDNWFKHVRLPFIVGSKWLEEQRVGEVSARNGLGKHTTRNVSLLPLSRGGYLADTPGFSQPSLMKVTAQSLAQHFPEVSAIESSLIVLFICIYYSNFQYELRCLTNLLSRSGKC
ncbi:hypothetical protein RD792_016557 [Penstemon davidsonii]|uniref:Uncharacterized protein n=1 Tax=Penstemon davidsonii TaxID=160366 RepID=A0ABR0CKW9_9LAMI|nr:hypothetical protein RD792_016557 [Penstemon davidsonii]